MEKLNFNYGTLIGLLSIISALCLYVFNRLLLDIKDLKKWQLKQDARITAVEKVLEKVDICFEYIKKDLTAIHEDLKK